MTYSEACENLLKCVEEYAVIYHKIQVLEVCMYIAWFFFFVALYMVVRYMLIPTIKGALQSIELPSEQEPASYRQVTGKLPEKRYDIEELLREFEK